jgi:hypothetical protein
MLEYFQASTYTRADFHSFLTLYFMQNACILCGQVHELRFHGYVRRLVRSNATSTNKAILICVIICISARAASKQYTKRILPPFVTPECNIGLDNAFEMYRAMPDGRIDYDRASELLGSVCVKTMRRHYLMAVAFTEVAVLLLTKYLALSAPLLPQSGQPQEELLMLFVSMMQTVCDLEVQRSEKHHDLAPPTLYLHPVYVFMKSRTALWGEKPLGLSSVIGFYFDTS